MTCTTGYVQGITGGPVTGFFGVCTRCRTEQEVVDDLRAHGVTPMSIPLDSIAQENLRRQYAQGLEDGALITLDMIEGKATHGGVPYDGPMPRRLREYIAAVRANAKTKEQT